MPTVSPLHWRLEPPDGDSGAWARSESAQVLADCGASAGDHPRDRLTGWLNAVCAHHLERAHETAAGCDPGQLVDRLVQSHEALRFTHVAEQAGVRFGLVAGEAAELLREALRRTPARAVSLRTAVELHSARPPSGDAAPSRELLERLWAHAFEISQLGNVSDQVHLGLTPSRLVEGPLGLEPPGDPELDSQLGQHADALLEERGDALGVAIGIGAPGPALTASESEREQALLEVADAALAEHAGVTLRQLGTLTTWLAELAGFEQPESDDLLDLGSTGGFNSSGEQQLVEVTAAALELNDDDVRRAIDFLSIGPHPDYPSRDDRAWVYGRERSFQTRPLVRHADGRTLSWSGVHTFLSTTQIASQIAYASLPGVPRDSALWNAMHALSSFRGEIFEQQVRDVARADFRLAVRRVAALDGRPLVKPNGDPLGDVDALVAVPACRVLLALEAKAFSSATTPREIHSELERLRATGGDTTDMDRHLMRVELLRRDVPAALRAVGLSSAAPEAAEWEVHGAVVTLGNPLAGALSDAPAPIVSLRTLRELDLVRWAAELHDRPSGGR